MHVLALLQTTHAGAGMAMETPVHTARQQRQAATAGKRCGLRIAAERMRMLLCILTSWHLHQPACMIPVCQQCVRVDPHLDQSPAICCATCEIMSSGPQHHILWFVATAVIDNVPGL